MARAAPLSPDARRASIIAATLPLLRIHGRSVTTSQIAMAAGVAEGTLFRVFADKEELIAAAVASAFDPTSGIADLGRIDRSQSLRDKLIQAVEMLQRRIADIWQLIAMLQLAPTSERRAPPEYDDTPLRRALASLFEPHRDEVRCTAEQAARLLRACAFAASHPRLIDQPLTPHEVVTLLLDGIRSHPDEDI